MGEAETEAEGESGPDSGAEIEGKVKGYGRESSRLNLTLKLLPSPSPSLHHTSLVYTMTFSDDWSYIKSGNRIASPYPLPLTSPPHVSLANPRPHP